VPILIHGYAMLKKRGNMRSSLSEYFDEVIEAIVELGQYTEDVALAMATEKRGDVEYGCKYRISPSLVAGSILGINDCCLTRDPTLLGSE